MTLAPIALFVYKRPEHTRKTLEALKQCPEFTQSPVFIFSDGAKNEEDLTAVEETRQVVHSMMGKEVKIIEASQNKGLANSIIDGVTHLVNEFEKVIVLEDDLVVSPKFLEYMNNALEQYKNENSVMQISGYMFPVSELKNQNEALFLPFIYSWGWATWKRAWDKFDEKAEGWEILKTDNEMRDRFNLDNNYSFFDMINRQMSGEIDSWAIRWYWSVFKHNGYILYPPISYVTNIGFDGSGTHGSWYASLRLGRSESQPFLVSITLPKKVEINQQKYNYVKTYMRTLQPTWIKFLKKLMSPELVLQLRNYTKVIKSKLP
ncbi:glycosyltransferase [Geminocystis sp. NIES-3709]|uniref:glycosyltransferase n=1 Tax=Geminocystis sp. NIES-3709 TaxID=1617448 RepID=UPI0005FC5BB1|nr:glycosyltransferase [Geminocystis sp. NIES-3709]BAQ64483.1 sugar transferase [Geminocystis sp. NIES-3709]